MTSLESNFVRVVRRSLACWPVALALVGATFVSLATPTTPAAADSPGDTYLRIEEDWELVIAQPAVDIGAPQVVTQMAPSPDSDLFCKFHVNHRILPRPAVGGLEVQIWNGKVNQASKQFGVAVLATNGEKINWTQFMERNGSTLKFGIVQGLSLTYGDLRLPQLHTSCPDNKPNFDKYESDYSAENSGIMYGANRVTSLTLVKVRKYKSSSLIPSDVEVLLRPVFKLSDLQ